MSVSPLTVRAVPGFIDGVEAEERKRIHPLIGHQDNAASVATSAAVRPAPGHTPLPPEAYAAIAALASAEEDLYPVDKHDGEARTLSSKGWLEMDSKVGKGCGKNTRV